MLYLCYRTDKKISFHKLTSKLSPSKFHLSQENLNNNKIKTNIKTTIIDRTFISVTGTGCAQLLLDHRRTVGKCREHEGTGFKGTRVETTRTISPLSTSERQEASDIRRTVAIARECSQGSGNQGVQRGKDLGDLLASSRKRAKGHNGESWRGSRVDRDAGE